MRKNLGQTLGCALRVDDPRYRHYHDALPAQVRAQCESRTHVHQNRTYFECTRPSRFFCRTFWGTDAETDVDFCRVSPPAGVFCIHGVQNTEEFCAKSGHPRPAQGIDSKLTMPIMRGVTPDLPEVSIRKRIIKINKPEISVPLVRLMPLMALGLRKMPSTPGSAGT